MKNTMLCLSARNKCFLVGEILIFEKKKDKDNVC